MFKKFPDYTGIKKGRRYDPMTNMVFFVAGEWVTLHPCMFTVAIPEEFGVIIDKRKMEGKALVFDDVKALGQCSFYEFREGGIYTLNTKGEPKFLPWAAIRIGPGNGEKYTEWETQEPYSVRPLPFNLPSYESLLPDFAAPETEPPRTESFGINVKYLQAACRVLQYYRVKIKTDTNRAIINPVDSDAKSFALVMNLMIKTPC